MDEVITLLPEHRLTQAEFFDWVQRRPMRDVNRYELIQGRIVMSPGASHAHAKCGHWLGRKLGNHVEERSLGIVLDSSAAYDLPNGDVLEPDISFISQELDANPVEDEHQFTKVVPDLVVEVLSPSTAWRDRGQKKDIYAACGVREYWLVDVRRREVALFVLESGSFSAATVVRSGIVPSQVLPGLQLSVDELFRY